MVQELVGLKLFLGYSFNCQVMLANKFNVMFYLCIIGTEEEHRGAQRFDKSTQIC